MVGAKARKQFRSKLGRDLLCVWRNVKHPEGLATVSGSQPRIATVRRLVLGLSLELLVDARPDIPDLSETAQLRFAFLIQLFDGLAQIRLPWGFSYRKTSW